MGRIHPQNSVAADKSRRIYRIPDCSFHIRALRDGQWQSAFKVAVSSPCLTKDKNVRPVWKCDSHGI